MGGNSLADEILQIVRSLSSSLSVRLTNLLSSLPDPMRASSLGAIAGLAIALFCTWKYLKSPRQRRGRLAKSEDLSAGVEQPAEDSSTATSSSVSLSSTQPRQRGVLIQEPSVPVQLTLAQVVRKQLNGAHKMTCQVLGILLEENSPDELQKHAVVRPAVVDVLLELARSCDLYLMARVLDDESEANVLGALEAVGLFTMGGLNRNKVLFCSTEAGRNSFVRQLEPDWHVDTSAEVLSQLARFVRYELHVSSTQTGFVAPNVFSSDTLEAYFGANFYLKETKKGYLKGREEEPGKHLLKSCKGSFIQHLRIP